MHKQLKEDDDFKLVKMVDERDLETKVNLADLQAINNERKEKGEKHYGDFYLTKMRDNLHYTSKLEAEDTFLMTTMVQVKINSL